MLIDAKRSALLLIDLQEKMLPAIEDAAQVLANACWLVDVARALDVPLMATEQYPQGLGATVSALGERLRPEEIGSKLHFSCLGAPCLEGLPGFARRQLVVAGAEAHVCVLQTVLDLLQSGKQVFIVEEAVGSRRAADKCLAIERMRQAGAVIVSREMVAFEWLRVAGTDLFRHVSKTYIR